MCVSVGEPTYTIYFPYMVPNLLILLDILK